jgi:type IV pilus biogenesis protein CpaD/CtpE
MKKLVLTSVMLLFLAACSSKPKQPETIGQYCYTDQEITKIDGAEISSETIVKCSDRPKVNHLTRSAGVADQCRSYTHTIRVNGVNKNVKGFLCRFPGGTWERVNGAYAY